MKASRVGMEPNGRHSFFRYNQSRDIYKKNGKDCLRCHVTQRKRTWAETWKPQEGDKVVVVVSVSGGGKESF